MRNTELPTVRWVFFDLGNTLIDERRARRRLIAQISQRVLRKSEGLTVDDFERRIAQGFSLFAPHPWLYALTSLLGSRNTADQILHDLPYPKHLEKLYPQALSIIPALARAGFRLGVIANQSHGTEARLHAYGLGRYFSLCFSSAELGVAKPDHAIFHLAAARSGCRPSELMMVGDRIDNDIRPARECGWLTVRVFQGLAQNQQPRNSLDQADWSCRTLAEVGRVVGVHLPE